MIWLIFFAPAIAKGLLLAATAVSDWLRGSRRVWTHWVGFSPGIAAGLLAAIAVVKSFR